MTFSIDKIHNHGDKDNSGPIGGSLTECSSQQGEMPSAKCQCVTWVPEGGKGGLLSSSQLRDKIFMGFDNPLVLGGAEATFWIFTYSFFVFFLNGMAW